MDALKKVLLTLSCLAVLVSAPACCKRHEKEGKGKKHHKHMKHEGHKHHTKKMKKTTESESSY